MLSLIVTNCNIASSKDLSRCVRGLGYTFLSQQMLFNIISYSEKTLALILCRVIFRSSPFYT